MARVFFAFRDSPQRRAALAAAPGAPERYLLFGLDEARSQGFDVEHNLARTALGRARAADRAINAILYRSGGYGGDFASLLTSLRSLNAADAVLSTVDTVGVPLVLLKRARLARPPLVYVSIGLPERLEQLRGERVANVYRAALGRCGALVAYAAAEADRLRAWVGAGGPRVHFVPFGVDVRAFHPVDREPECDVLSIGADPRRDFASLLRMAGRRGEWTFRIVTTSDHARTFGPLPPNLWVETDVPLATVRERMAAARVVALPVRDNSYSGATTTLLQAMAMAKPVVVSRTAAIESGYGLEDGFNCRLVQPSDEKTFERALAETLTGAGAAESIGARARETVERNLSWERYTNRLFEILSSVSSLSGRTPSSQ
jgi:glycosyltransferase involved in cell wall biosynthesis